MKVTQYTFSKHALIRIGARVHVDSAVFSSYVNEHPESTLVLYEGSLPKLKTKRGKVLREGTFDRHLLVKFNNEYYVLVINVPDKLVITVLTEEFYRRKGWAVAVTTEAKNRINNQIRTSGTRTTQANPESSKHFEKIDAVPSDIRQNQHILKVNNDLYMFKCGPLGKLVSEGSYPKMYAHLRSVFTKFVFAKDDKIVLTTGNGNSMLIPAPAMMMK